MTTDGTEVLNGAYWANVCEYVPADTTMLMIKMGLVMDYMRPNTGVSYCDMLSSGSVNYEVSYDGVNWFTPSDYSGHYGGSNNNDLPDGGNGEDDERVYLSFRGSDSSVGGCCHSSYSDGAAWGQAFEMVYDTLPIPGKPSSETEFAPDAVG